MVAAIKDKSSDYYKFSVPKPMMRHTITIMRLTLIFLLELASKMPFHKCGFTCRKQKAIRIKKSFK
jgi:hypothetical protein